jgi:hypothetical protein
MAAYIIRRLLLMIPTLFGIMAVSFLVVQFAPGGPVERVLPEIRRLRFLRSSLLGPLLRRILPLAPIILALMLGPNAHLASGQRLPYATGIESPGIAHSHQREHSLAAAPDQHHESGACHGCRAKLTLLPPPPLDFVFLDFDNSDFSASTDPMPAPSETVLRDVHAPRAPPRAA